MSQRMERNSINCIIFDEEEPSLKEHPDRTVTSSQAQFQPKSHTIDIIEQEITYLAQKIRNLQGQAEAISRQKMENPSICRQSSTSIDLLPVHSTEIMMAIERKIQIIVRQTRRIVDQLGQTFDRKLQVRLREQSQQTGVSKLKQQYNSSIRNIEQTYRTQVQRLQQLGREGQKKMIGRVNMMEQKMVKRMKQFEGKEKEYVDWIHHLERQLQEKEGLEKKVQQLQERYEKQEQQLQIKDKEYRDKEVKDRQLRDKQSKDRQIQQQKQQQQQRIAYEKRQQQQKQLLLERQQQEQRKRERQLQKKQLLQRDTKEVSKSRRKIQMTHVKKQPSENSSILTGDNYESVISRQKSSQVNDSKIQRRHKIFDFAGNNGNTSNSVSPQPYNSNHLSPINPMNNSSKTPTNILSSKIINPLTRPKTPLENQQKQFPQRQDRSDKPGLVIEKVTEPMKNNFTGERQLSPWRQMDVEKSQGLLSSRQKMAKQVHQQEFLKDVPKASMGWQRFQDYEQNDQSSSDSEQDIVFYRNEQKKQSQGQTNWGAERDSKWVNFEKTEQAQSSKGEFRYKPVQQGVFSPFDLN